MGDDGERERAREPEKKSDGLDCDGDCCCGCDDGAGCIAALVFIALFASCYALYWTVSRLIGRTPARLRDWHEEGALYWVAVVACAAAAIFAWIALDSSGGGAGGSGA